MELTFTEQTLASVSGGALTALTMTPFDVVKVRAQASAQPINYFNGLMDHVICPCARSKSEGNRRRLLGGTGAFTIDKRLKQIFTRPGRGGSCNTKCLSPIECHKRNFYRHQPLPQANNIKWYNRCPVSESNTFRSMIKLAQTEGVSTLWSGLPATIVMALPSTVMYFTAYEYCKSSFSSSSLLVRLDQPLISPFLAGCSARFLAVSLISPLELIRTRMQVDGSSSRSVLAQVGSSISRNGVGALYLGYSASILRDVPFSGIYFCFYEFFKLALGPSVSPVSRDFLSAGGAAAIAGTLTLPLDVIKTRQQMLLGDNHSRSSNLSIFKTYSEIVREGGHRALLSGFGPRILKVVPACAIMMSSYQFSKRYFISKRDES
jgi:solute carrier family 25 protein 39/40